MPHDSMGRAGPSVRIRVLGTVALEPANEDHDPPVLGPRLRRLLAALAARANTVVSVDALADAVWAGDPPATPEGAMHTLVSRLRATLRATDPTGSDGGATKVLTRAPGYVLSVAPGSLDSNRFELLAREGRSAADQDPGAATACFAEALALWRGAAYAEFADEDFARPEAARLDGLRATLVEDYAEALLELGRPEEAVPLLEVLVADEPLRERARSGLMLAEYRRGRQAEALRTFAAHRELLAEELGIDPSPNLQRLHEDILRQDPRLDPPAQPPTSARIEARHDGTGASARAGGPPGNLPPTAPALIGREVELEVLGRLVRPGAVLTLTGPGGVGKTSLALRLGSDTIDRFPDGVWFCDLASLRSDDDVALAVMSSLDLRASGGSDGTANLLAHLRTRRLLLVLDNCEHILEDSAALVHAVHGQSPDVGILATSRAPLDVSDEQVWSVPPLTVPAADGSSDDLAVVAATPAVQLFVNRTRQRLEAFELGPGNADAVAEICRRLDGLPLAIELAAARMGAISPADLVDRLNWRFRLLHGGTRTGSERHRTLRALVDWSFDLLDEDHRRVFEVLSLFAGDFDLDDVGRLVRGVPELEFSDEGQVADIVLGLVDRSMVSVFRGAHRTRYSMLETLRTYGRQQLMARTFADAAHLAHARMFVDLTADAASRLYGPEHVAASTSISGHLAELRVAHTWALVNDLELAARLVGSLMLYVEHRMPVEVQHWAERTLRAAAAGDPPPGLAGAHAVAAAGARFTGNLAHAVELGEQGLQLASDPMTAAYLRFVLAEVALFEGRLEDVDHQRGEVAALGATAELGPVALLVELLEPLVVAYRGDEAGAARIAADIETRAARQGAGPIEAWARYLRAEVMLDTDPEGAVEVLASAIELARTQGDRYASGVAMVSAASLRGRHGDPLAAVPLYRDVIEHWSSVGDWTHQWTSLRGVVDLLLRLGRDEDAALLRGALVDRARAAPIFGPDAERMAVAETLLRQRLGDDVFSELSQQGARLADADVVTFARTVLTPPDLPAQRSR